VSGEFGTVLIIRELWWSSWRKRKEV